MKPYLIRVSSKYGAPMGRRDYPTDAPVKLRMERVRLVDGDYDPGGAYWGGGSGTKPLYCAWGRFANGEAVTVYVRANTRREARAEVRKSCPLATFWR